jgi:hypothetical protein
MEPSCRIVDIRSFYADCVSFALGVFFFCGLCRCKFGCFSADEKGCIWGVVVGWFVCHNL